MQKNLLVKLEKDELANMVLKLDQETQEQKQDVERWKTVAEKRLIHVTRLNKEVESVMKNNGEWKKDFDYCKQQLKDEQREKHQLKDEIKELFNSIKHLAKVGANL